MHIYKYTCLNGAELGFCAVLLPLSRVQGAQSPPHPTLPAPGPHKCPLGWAWPCP